MMCIAPSMNVFMLLLETWYNSFGFLYALMREKDVFRFEAWKEVKFKSTGNNAVNSRC